MVTCKKFLLHSRISTFTKELFFTSISMSVLAENVCFFSLFCGVVGRIHVKTAHTHRDERPEWVDLQMSFFFFFLATDGVPAAQRQRRRCSQRQKRKEKNTIKSVEEKGPRNICVIHISRVTSEETIYLSLFHLIGSSFLKLWFDWRPFLFVLRLISATHGGEEKWPGKRVSC